jgi:hypothetical protein
MEEETRLFNQADSEKLEQMRFIAIEADEKATEQANIVVDAIDELP